MASFLAAKDVSCCCEEMFMMHVYIVMYIVHCYVTWKCDVVIENRK